tara:strand:- start:20988 stop:22373 length:1386 start_codon:yes stop_codon:yes gene_type:complete
MNIYFPIEVQQRELDSRVLFAIEAAKRGHKIYLGHKVNLYPLIPKLKPGIYFHKSIQVPKLSQIKQLKALGHFNVSIDEEGLNRICDEMYFSYKLSRKCLSEIDIFFAWGEDDKNLISKKYPESKSKIFSAGNSRIDLLKNVSAYSKKASHFKSKYGEFLFFPTKFGRCNFFKNSWDASKFGKFDAKKTVRTLADAMKSNIPSMSKELYEDLAKNESWEKKNMELYMDAIAKCAVLYRDKKIIIRPHPAEDIKVWKDFVKSLGKKNVQIITSGDSVIPWLLASYKTISHNCTTSLESSLMGKKSINYTPLKNDNYEWEIPLLIANTARDFDSLINFINQKEHEKSDNEKISYFIRNYRDKSFCYFSLNVIESLVDQDTYSKINKTCNFLQLLIGKLINKLKVTYSLYFGSGRRRRKKFKQKFKGFNYKQVLDLVSTYDNAKNIILKEEWPGIFSIENNNLN